MRRNCLIIILFLLVTRLDNMKGDLITLRALEPSDLQEVYTLENEEGQISSAGNYSSFSRYTISEFIKNSNQDIVQSGQFRWVVQDNEDDSFAGLIDLYDYDAINRRAGIGIYIIPTKRGRSFALEAIDVLVSYCHRVLNLNQVYCQIEIDNLSSKTLFEEKAGFKLSGIQKEWNIRNSNPIDVCFYQKILK
jgi:diamine N-acetyltransferase